MKKVKVCQRCEVEKSISEFFGPWKNRPHYDQYDGYCKPCRRAYNRAYYDKKKAEKKTIPDHKVCACCNGRKGEKEFPRDGKSGDGLSSYCRECKALMSRVKTVRGQRKRFNPPAEKTCLLCGETKTWEGFRRNARLKDGLSNQCRACLSARERARLAKLNNPVSVEMKVCYDCCEEKSADEFHRDRRRPDGLKSNCKLCGNERLREWYRRKREKAKV